MASHHYLSPVPAPNNKGNKMANETVEEEDLSKEITRFLDKNVGTEKSSASKVYSLLQGAITKKKCLETEVSAAGNSRKDGSFNVS